MALTGVPRCAVAELKGVARRAYASLFTAGSPPLRPFLPLLSQPSQFEGISSSASNTVPAAIFCL